jgi:ankyrin repeat protein
MNFSPKTNPKHKEVIFKQTYQGLVMKSDEELVESLKTLPEDTNFDYIDGEYNTMLFLAAANNRVKTVEYLLQERKVNPNFKVSEDLTAAHIAAKSGYTKVLKALIKCPGILLAEKDMYGETPLFRAIGSAPANTLIATVILLVHAQKEAVLISNEDNVEPIELALQRKSSAVIRLLLDNGATVSERCVQVAATMLVGNGQRTRQNNVFVFELNNPTTEDVYECAKLIIKAKQIMPATVNQPGK